MATLLLQVFDFFQTLRFLIVQAVDSLDSSLPHRLYRTGALTKFTTTTLQGSVWFRLGT
jgi:hypothetical protein